MAFPLPVRISNAELYRNQQAIEQRTQASFKALDDRISGVSQNMMRADVAQLIHDDMNKRIATLQANADRASDHAWSTRSTALMALLSGGAAAAVTLLITLVVR